MHDASGAEPRAPRKTSHIRGDIPALPFILGIAGGKSRRSREPSALQARIIQPRAPAAVRDAIRTAPVSLGQAAIKRIFREENEASMLLAFDREIAARLAPRGSREMTRLRRHVAELEAENERLRHALREAGLASAALAPVLMR